MLVDLGRNDLGRLSRFGTVKVEKYMSIERYSHVMHIGSTVRGEISDDKDALDAISSVLPAGTLSGAPKIRAYEIIHELEKSRRGIYGGAIGYLSGNGDMDTCIVIRSAFVKNQTAYVQAGAGVVYDSVPLFYEEWNDASSELLIACDEEVQQICRALPEFELQYVKSLRIHYESPTAQAMTKKISSIPAFQGLTSPMREAAPGQWVPDFSSRYFKADFPYGLKAIKDIAVLADVPVPTIDEVYAWYRGVTGDMVEFDAVPKTLEELTALYI